jgi:hypothetical protein
MVERRQKLRAVPPERLPSGLPLNPVALGNGDLRKFFGLDPLPGDQTAKRPKLKIVRSQGSSAR